MTILVRNPINRSNTNLPMIIKKALAIFERAGFTLEKFYLLARSAIELLNRIFPAYVAFLSNFKLLSISLASIINLVCLVCSKCRYLPTELAYLCLGEKQGLSGLFFDLACKLN